jgi:type I restriction enzyme M protein
MPVLGLIFLRHAFNRYLSVEKETKKNLPSRGGVTRPITKEDFAKKSALFLQEKSQYEYLLKLPAGKDRGKAIIEAMDAIEADYPSLAGVLPKDYHIFGPDLLGRLLKIFNDEALRKPNGDVFGRIYEYFLMKFAMAGAQDSGEFFTPISLVQTIVNVIEPDHGTVLDPACGSGGMFVQTSHFLERTGRETHATVTFYGQESKTATIRLARMNLAVHGLEGKIAEGNTFYEDQHEKVGKCDFVMANPPFNVDGVDAEKIKGDPRLPFGLPGVNVKKEVSNGNYLWISYFYSYLNDSGRAGFVMSSQASSAGHGEKDVRRKIVETGHVDVMISIRSNFFYTRSVPCELWFFDRAKPEAMRDKVLMLDARNIFRKVTRKIYDFSPEQLKNISAIIWLYRGHTDKYLGLVKEYIGFVCKECETLLGKLNIFDKTFTEIYRLVSDFLKASQKNEDIDSEKIEKFSEAVKEIEEASAFYTSDKGGLLADIDKFYKKYRDSVPEDNKGQHEAQEKFSPITDKIKGLTKQIDFLYKLTMRSVDIIEKELDAKNNGWDSRAASRLKKELDGARKDAIEQLKLARYFYKQVEWLQTRFPDAGLADVEGLVKLVDKAEIEANDWSLTPGLYVGVAPPEEDEDFDFEEVLRDIHIELVGLNEEAAELARTIQSKFEDLGI